MKLLQCILFLKFQVYVLLKQIYVMAFSSSICEISKLEACSLLMTDRKGVWIQRGEERRGKEGRSGGGEGETGRSRGREYCNQDIFYEERIYFQWEGKRKRIFVIYVLHKCDGDSLKEKYLHINLKALY